MEEYLSDPEALEQHLRVLYWSTFVFAAILGSLVTAAVLTYFCKKRINELDAALEDRED